MTNSEVQEIRDKVNGHDVIIAELRGDLKAVSNSVKSIDGTLKEFTSIYRDFTLRETQFCTSSHETQLLVRDLKSEVQSQKDTIKRHEDNFKWVSRLVLGAVILAALSFILMKK